MPQDIEFLMPYAKRVAANLATGMERHIMWARSQGLLPDAEAEQVYRFCQHAEVGAWFCPAAESERDLEIQLDINGWYFVFDDAFDVPRGKRADGAVAVCQELLELLVCSCPLRPGASPLVSAFMDVWRRESDRMPPAWRQRAVSTWADALSGNLAEEADRRVGAALEPASYMDVRRRTVGVLSDFDMYETMGPHEVPPLAWYSSHLRTMRTCTVEHVIMVNDVCSLEKDEARGDANLVHLLMDRDRCPRAAAIPKVVAMANDRMRRFQTLEQGVPFLCDRLALDENARVAVERHVDAMIHMLSGNYHWSRACGRYSLEAAAQLDPGHPGLLASRDLTRSEVTPLSLRSRR
jgi:pentalenene synthase